MSNILNIVKGKLTPKDFEKELEFVEWYYDYPIYRFEDTYVIGMGEFDKLTNLTSKSLAVLKHEILMNETF